MAFQYTQAYSAITSGSTSTSKAFFVGDFRLLTVSFASGGSLGPSRFTVEGSNADGLQTSDLGGPTSALGWSLVSGVNMIGATPGMVTLDPLGYRWMRITTAPATTSIASATTIIINGVSF